MDSFYAELDYSRFMSELLPSGRRKVKALTKAQMKNIGDFNELRRDFSIVPKMYPFIYPVLEKTLRLSRSNLTFKMAADRPDPELDKDSDEDAREDPPDIVAYPMDIAFGTGDYAVLTSKKRKEEEISGEAREAKEPQHEQKSQDSQGLRRSKRQKTLSNQNEPIARQTLTTQTPANLKRRAMETEEMPDTNKARTAWAWIELVVQVKLMYAEAGFHFGRDRFLRNSDTGHKSRTQLMEYATEIMHRQHRTHLFMILIAKDSARLLRWDRAGAVVSKPINLLKNPRHLLDFIHQFGQMTPEQRGHDPSAALVGDDELLKVVEEYEPADDWARECKALILNNRAEFPIYQITCPDIQATWETRTFLIGKPLTEASSPTGKATKGVAAYEVTERRMVFFKDYWRTNSSHIHQEIDVYTRLTQFHVQSVATAIAGGDADGPCAQRTLTQKYIGDGRQSSERVHCYLVLQELCRPLTNYQGSMEVIYAIIDALRAHEAAFEKAGILHRDISPGNIVFSPQSTPEDPRALLVDWDLCQYKEDMNSLPRQPGGRGGTWAFLSALALRYPKKPIQVTDDLESFLYVLLYCAARFHLHDLSPDGFSETSSGAELARINSNNGKLSRFVSNLFYEEWHEDGYHAGGEYKKMAIDKGKSPITIYPVDGDTLKHPLMEAINGFYSLLQKHYSTLNYDELQPYSAQQPRVSAPVHTRTRITRTEEETSGGDSQSGFVTQSPPRGAEGRQADQTSSTSSSSMRPEPITNKQLCNVLLKVTENHRDCVRDKWPDQFYALPILGPLSARRPSGSRKSGISSTSQTH